jgi:hypothetical protein
MEIFDLDILKLALQLATQGDNIMSQEIQPIKKKPGRPRKIQLLESDSAVAVIDDDLDTVILVEEEEKDFDFISTGNEVKDRALKGVITDSPILFTKANAQKKWEAICASANPAGECEKFAISQFIKDEDKVVPTLLAVKRLMVRNRDGLTVIKAFQLSKLQDFIERITGKTIAVTPVVPEVKTVETIAEVVKPVEKQVPIVTQFVKGQVVTNPDDPTQTWTVGSRGRHAKWIDKLLENATIETEKQVVKTVKPDPVKFEKGQKVFNPDDETQFWIVGNRGRKPTFFVDLENGIGPDKKIKIVASNIVVNPNYPSQTFDISKRGRRPNWVIDYLKTHKI